MAKQKVHTQRKSRATLRNRPEDALPNQDALQNDLMRGASDANNRYAVTFKFSKTYTAKDVGVGSGSLLDHQGKLYILTCAHVAELFFKADNVVPHADRSRPALGVIERANMILDPARIMLDEREDIALIEIKDRQTVRGPGPFLTMEDIAFIDDFRRIPNDERGFIMLGNPWEGRRLFHGGGKAGIEFPLEPFLTIRHVSRNDLKGYLYLQYPKGESMRVHIPESGISGRAPLHHAGGYSGGPVRMVPHFRADHSIWDFTRDTKIVAITESLTGKVARCAPLLLLKKWLP